MEQARHFKVDGGFHVDGTDKASVTIRPVHGGWMVEVRPKGHRRVYALSLAMVAEMVAWRVAKLEEIGQRGTR